MELYNACFSEYFPSIDTMSKYGLTGYQGTNPIAIFDCYKLAIKYDNISVEQLETTKNLNDLIMKSPSVTKSIYYDSVIKKGGIKCAPQISECTCCGLTQCLKI